MFSNCRFDLHGFNFLTGENFDFSNVNNHQRTTIIPRHADINMVLTWQQGVSLRVPLIKPGAFMTQRSRFPFPLSGSFWSRPKLGPPKLISFSVKPRDFGPSSSNLALARMRALICLVSYRLPFIETPTPSSRLSVTKNLSISS